MNPQFSVERRSEFLAGRQRDAFTLLELIAAMGIVLILAALLVPALKDMQQKARAVSCANNLRQIYSAFTLYLGDNNNMIFWKGPRSLGLDGMDWYVYGGQETGNTFTGQEGLFNRMIPRPLNPYLNKTSIFRCPSDIIKFGSAQGYTLFEWAGTSYNFNATGPYTNISQADTMGLSGVSMARVAKPSEMVIFYDGSFVKGAGQWHGAKENVCFLDGHLEPLTPEELKTKLARTVEPSETLVEATE